MRFIALLALLSGLGPLRAAADSPKVADPFVGAFFPPELVLLASDRIALTLQQREAFHARMEKTKLRIPLAGIPPSRSRPWYAMLGGGAGPGEACARKKGEQAMRAASRS